MIEKSVIIFFLHVSKLRNNIFENEMIRYEYLTVNSENDVIKQQSPSKQNNQQNNRTEKKSRALHMLTEIHTLC